MPAPKKNPATAPVSADEVVDNTTDPVKSYKSSGVKQDRVTLFEIDDEKFTVPAKPPMNVTLKFLNEYRKNSNEMAAALGLMEALLGETAFAKFLDWDELTDDIFSDVLNLCTDLALGRAEGAAKN